MNWMIRLLARLTGSVPPGEGTGLALSSEDYWILTKPGTLDLQDSIRRIAELFPNGSTLYVEGTSIAQDVHDFLAARPSEDVTQVMTGTYWPKPRTYRMPLTKDNTEGLADLVERHAEPEICDHLVIYRYGKVLMEWWDTPSGAILLNPDTPESAVHELCRIMDCSYERRSN